MKIWEAEFGRQPEQLQPLIGLRVYRAWLSPAGTLLLLLLEKRRTVMFEPAPVVGEYRACVRVDTGTALEGLEEIAAGLRGNEPHLKDLRNRIFEGVDSDVVMFSGNIGAKITPEGVQWVKAAD